MAGVRAVLRSCYTDVLGAATELMRACARGARQRLTVIGSG